MVTILLILVAGLATLAIALSVALMRARAASAPSGREGEPRAGASPAWISRAFDVLPLAALQVDSDTRLVAANTLARERFPFLRPGQLLLDLFGEHQLSERVAASLASGEPARFELRLFAEDRRTFHIVVEPLPLDGLAQALVFMTDLTQAIAYQELRSQFVANVSHELRTPITGLRGLLEALDDEGMDSRTHRRFVGKAIAETQRLEALITDILFLSELEAAPGLPPGEQSDLTRAAHDAAEVLAARARDMRVQVEVRATRPAPVPLSERLARTVVQNLLENAIKYGGPNAWAVVEVRDDPGAGRVELIVTDTGPGIPERHLPHIFERFYRADPSRSRSLGGTGLGLSIVKHIVERVGGRAEATSREGFGATVTVQIPSAVGMVKDSAAARTNVATDSWTPSAPSG